MDIKQTMRHKMSIDAGCPCNLNNVLHCVPDFFRFPKVKWPQYTGEVGKCISY